MILFEPSFLGSTIVSGLMILLGLLFNVGDDSNGVNTDEKLFVRVSHVDKTCVETS